MGSLIHPHFGNGPEKYKSEKLRQGTIEWEILAISFTHTFEFESEHPTVDVVLQFIKEKIFEEILVAEMNFHQCSMTTHS